MELVGTGKLTLSWDGIKQQEPPFGRHVGQMTFVLLLYGQNNMMLFCHKAERHDGLPLC